MTDRSLPALPGYSAAEVLDLKVTHSLWPGDIRLLARFLDHFDEDLDAVPGPDPEVFRHYILVVEGFGAVSRDAYRRLNVVRKTYRVFYQPSPFLRALDAGIAALWREIKPKKARKDYVRRPLRFSVPEEDLPLEWREALTSMEFGFAGVEKAAPAPSVLNTLRRKVCELAKAAGDARLAMDLTVETASAYERSLLNRERPLSATTVRSSMLHIRDFALYLGAEDPVIKHLKGRVARHESRAGRNTPLKESKVQKVPTYTEVFERAFDMLGQADETKNRRTSQKLRNYAGALALMCPFPLRVANTRLRFGDNLNWTGETYQLFVPATSKNGDAFQAVLAPFFRLFVDQLVLQGAHADYLDELREKCLADRRLLFESYDGSTPFDTYVSYVWQEVYGTGSHIARAKIHDELAVFGAAGVEGALKACTHRSRRSAEHYRTRAFRLLAGDHVRKAAETSIQEDEWRTYFEDG